MLIRFNVTNFLSFKEETEFNMLAGSPRSKKEHIYHHRGIDFMRAAALYGANGAGKSNLIKAISFLQGLVIGQERTQYNKHFKLVEKFDLEPSTFEIEFIKDNIIFAYSLSILKEVIVEESLYEIESGQKDQLLFERKQNERGETKIIINEEYQVTEKDKLLIELYEDKFLKNNELLLSKIKEDDIDFDKFIIAFDWFYNSLQVIYPYTKFNTSTLQNQLESNVFKFTQKIITNLDTGVASLDFEEFGMEEFLGEDDRDTQEALKEELEKESFVILEEGDGRHYIATKRGDKIIICRMLTNHQTNSEKLIPFDISEESDGTQRLLDLLPAIYMVINNDKVFVIDEINRSVHPTLTRELIKLFMDTKETKGQLIFSTHESQLLDLNIFRQDEIWFAEKNKSGATELYPLSDFKVRPDLVLKKGYLNGRFGAVPFLGNLKDLNWEEAKEDG